MTINIQSVAAFPSTAVQLQVTDGHVDLGQGANFQATLLDANGVIVSSPVRVALTEDQYSEWTGDDRFVAECVAENLGLSPKV